MTPRAHTLGWPSRPLHGAAALGRWLLRVAALLLLFGGGFAIGLVT